mmetsp:Transcript_36011/g.107720  ORF Transcript_36011/g.107720 Transcript_36011/m.107720 type:complete len:145 (-) Transcript_36011:80-514(-)
MQVSYSDVICMDSSAIAQEGETAASLCRRKYSTALRRTGGGTETPRGEGSAPPRIPTMFSPLKISLFSARPARRRAQDWMGATKKRKRHRRSRSDVPSSHVEFRESTIVLHSLLIADTLPHSRSLSLDLSVAPVSAAPFFSSLR